MANNFAVSKDTLMKVGIAAAVALIVYLVLRARSCTQRERYAMFAAPRRRDGYAPFIRPTRPIKNRNRRRYLRERFAMYASPNGPRDDEYAESLLESQPAPADDLAEAAASLRAEDHLGSHLMQSTLEDDEANAMFSPDA